MSPVDELNFEVLRGRKVGVVGRLVSLTRGEFAELVHTCGGEFCNQPVRFSMLIVLGAGGLAGEQDSSAGSDRMLRRAHELAAYGFRMKFMPEAEFLEWIGLTQTAGDIRGRHTLNDLARVLQISPLRLRRWVQAGLIEPVEVHCHLAYFELPQIALARRIAELLAAGTSLAALRRSFEQLRELCPAENPSAQWSHITHDGRVLVRRGDELQDSTGQKYFDFETDPPVAVTRRRASSSEQTVAALFDAALELEDEGLLEQAAEKYLLALTMQPHDAGLHFNLGNVYFKLANFLAARQSYLTALANDPCYAEAWNNLGNCCAELSLHAEAEAALRRAVKEVPNYADAHFNLAELLKCIGSDAEAAVENSLFRKYSLPHRLINQRAELLRIVKAEV